MFICRPRAESGDSYCDSNKDFIFGSLKYSYFLTIRSQDFRVINISIPPNQIIDTTEIYHQPNQRYISLRFLCNYVLDRDMQQEVHDSVEDARASYELYKIALNLKSEGKFDEFLVQVYAEGHKTQFKII